MKTIVFISLILISTLNLSVASSEPLNFKMRPLENKKIHEGDVFRARIQIWPVLESDEAFNIKKGQSFLKHFYIVEDFTKSRSENNADVLFMEGLMILISKPQSSSLEWKIGEVKHFVQLELESEKTTLDQKALIVFEQAEEKITSFSLLYYLLALVLLGGLPFYKRIYYSLMRKSEIKKQKEKFKKFWGDRFSSASNRDEFEIIYARKREWLKLITLQTPPIVEFFRVMESVQYKKGWDEEETTTVKETFDNIRGIFN
ncbi:MAG: hypothetical protein KC493_03245 [Bacteriovoracaceae bacterium]|nr:hypothetical protein [Bacteriovoracaceae bacterium]